MPFDKLPSTASLKPKPFTAHVSDQDLNDFKQLLKLSKIGPKTFENQVTDVKDYNSWGISRAWLSEAKQRWETGYDWRKIENRINGFPNYSVSIEDEGYTFDVHFIALFSNKADAVPLILLHGWPGSILEFLDALDILRKKYDDQTLPYHVIVPSLPGYGYSSGPPLDKNFTTEDIATVVDKLMVGLGFGDGYITQGGDIGSFVSRILAVTKPACKAVHRKMYCHGGSQEMRTHENTGLDHRPSDWSCPRHRWHFLPDTRVGEKFLQWTDKSPPTDEILDSVTLYWFTNSFPRAIFPYRQFFGPKPTFFHPDAKFYIKKPLGYSWHAEELSPVPKDWVAKTGNLVFFRQHAEGGHFAAMEKPEPFVQDVEEFVAQVWPGCK